MFRSSRLSSIPGSGSFIRLTLSVCFGQSFLQALISKYVDESQSTKSKETITLGSSNGAIEVEAVGLDKVRGKLSRLERLRGISLDSENVAFPDPPGEIMKTCPSERETIDADILLSSLLSGNRREKPRSFKQPFGTLGCYYFHSS
jgi:tubulin-specific chaperone E